MAIGTGILFKEPNPRGSRPSDQDQDFFFNRETKHLCLRQSCNGMGGGGFPFAATDCCYCRSVSAVAAVSLLSHLLWLLSLLAQPRLLKEREVSRNFKRRHQPRRELREGIVDGAEMRYKHAQESPVHMQLCPVTFISKITYSTSPFLALCPTTLSSRFR